MTAATLPAPGVADARDRRPSLGRLTLVELRKMVDTRAGFWLQLGVAAITVAAVVIVAIAGNDDDRRFAQLLSVALAPSAILLPIIGILLVSSEWTQRTALVSFALVPHRSRVLLAKGLASVAVAFAALAVGIAVAAVGTVLAGSGAQDVWGLSGGLLGQDVVALVLAMLGGVAFGAAFLASAPAIVCYFVLPIAFSAVASIHAIHDVARWLDPSDTTSNITDHLLSGNEWARLGTSQLLWLGLPLLIGAWRIAKGEVR
jgi:ABC-type transport system involved in multi-copper enzyme maturation permease subunit